MPSTTAGPDLEPLLTSWTVHLRAERKSPSTIEIYTIGVRMFLAYCASAGCPAVLDRPTVNAFVAGLLDSGAGRWTVTFASGAPTASPSSRCSGWAVVASASATTA